MCTAEHLGYEGITTLTFFMCINTDTKMIILYLHIRTIRPGLSAGYILRSFLTAI